MSEAPAPSGADARLVRAIGTWGLAASIVNVTVGGGIFRLPAGVAASLGAAAPVAYVICTAVMALIVICFADAGSRVSLTGGPYAYVETAFGPFVGFLCGALLWVGMTFALSAVATFFADSVGALVPSLGPNGKRGALVVTLVAFAAANVRGVRGVTRANTVFTVAKLLPLLALTVFGAFAIRRENLAVTATPSAAAVSRASLLLLFAFLGVESALVPSGEVKDPARTVPRAIFLAMGAVALLYVAVQIVAQGLLGDALAGDPTPLASAAAVAMGPMGRSLILVGSVISMFGYVSGMTLAVPRMLFAFGRDGFLPTSLAAVHPRWRTPHVAIAAQTAIVILLALFGIFEKLAVAANATMLIVYAACCLAAVQLRRRGVQGGGVPFRVVGTRVAPWLALGVIGWLLWELKPAEWLAAGVIVVAAVLLFVATKASRRARVPA
ncbi:MAG: APC family permease [Gemmatimonadaceae bacterium]|nr:APC family permease [Gemmatimonadaceae bacterium]NUS31697.1 APC family permease [Gemmatimonadaceae bacterium]